MAAPANDLPANATTVAALSFSEVTDIREATATGNPGDLPDYDIGHSIWYKWTAPSNMRVLAGLAGAGSNGGSGAWTLINSVYTGGPAGPWTRVTFCICSNYAGVAMLPYNARVAFDAVAGTTYYFCAGANEVYGGGTSTVTFTLDEMPAPPANDRAANAIEVTAGLCFAAIDVRGATYTVGEDLDIAAWYGQHLLQTVWYKVRNARAGFITVSVSTAGSDYTPSVVIFGVDSAGAPATESLASGPGFFDIVEPLEFELAPGATVFVAIGCPHDPDDAYNVDYRAGSLTVTFTLTETGSAVEALPGGTILGSSPVLVTKTAAELNALGTPAHEIWFAYTATERDVPMLGILFYADPASNYKPRLLGVYTGFPSTSTGTLVTFGYAQRVHSIPVAAGVTYYFRVNDQNNSATLNAGLTVSFLPPPRLPMPKGSVVVNDDADAPYRPACIMGPPAQVLGFIQTVSGESGAQVPTGAIALRNDYGSEGIAFYTGALVLVAFLLDTALGSPTYPFDTYVGLCGCADGNFYVMYKASGNQVCLQRVSPTGVPGTVWLIDAAMTYHGDFFAVTADGADLVFNKCLNWPTTPELYGMVRHRLATGVQTVLTSETYAQSQQPIIEGVLVLPDGNILVATDPWEAGEMARVRLFDTAGTLLRTFWYHESDVPSGVSGADVWPDRMSHGDDFPNTFWLWLQSTDGSTDRNEVHLYLSINVADLTVRRVIGPIYEFEEYGGPYYRDKTYWPTYASLPRFGPADSCPFLAVNAAVVPEPDPGGAVDDTLPCTPCPVPGGGGGTTPSGGSSGSTPSVDDTMATTGRWIAECVGGGTVPTAADVTNSENWDPQ